MKEKPQHSKENQKRLSELKIEPVVKFSPSRWRDLVKESEDKRKHFNRKAGTRNWSRWRELRGIVAEEVVSVYTGLPRHRKLTDGGTDFFRTDVKGVPPVDPVLAVVPVNKDGTKIKWKADYFLCVVVDIYEHWGTILGYATRDEVKNSEFIQMPNALSHVVYPWDLHAGVPEELQNYANLMKGVK